MRTKVDRSISYVLLVSVHVVYCLLLLAIHMATIPFLCVGGLGARALGWLDCFQILYHLLQKTKPPKR